MANKVVGIEKVDYVSRKTNRPVQGTSFYILYEKQGVEGFVADKIFISVVSPCYPDAELVQVGDKLNIFYNRWGSVEGLQVLPSDKPEPVKK